jgi:hypothetical protein
MLSRLQSLLASMLGPGSELPIEKAGGLVWAYREFLPPGLDGDRLVIELADRMSAAGLYPRAAQLLSYMMDQRARDIQKGPLSVLVGILNLKADNPRAAIATIRSTSEMAYPADISADRQRIEALALARLGRVAEAEAMLEGLRDGPELAAEMRWRVRDWRGFSKAASGLLASRSDVGDAEANLILRQAIALSMINDELSLAALGKRYNAAMAQRSEVSLFRALTEKEHEPGAVIDAMAKLKDTGETSRWKALLVP